MAQKLIVDCTTGEQSVVDLTDEEEAARSAAQVEAETEMQQQQKQLHKRLLIKLQVTPN